MVVKIIMGTMQNDTVMGTDGDEMLLDLAGDDFVYAGDGNDDIYNDRGTDHLFGEGGNDLFSFHPKTATKIDPGHRVWIDGGTGDDTINFYRSEEGFELRDKGDRQIITFRGDAMRVVVENAEHVVFTDATWEL